MTNPGVIGLVGTEEGEVVLRLYSRGERSLFAIVIGSAPYVARALAAAGLAPSAIGLTKDRDFRWQGTLVRCQPANGNAQGTSEADDRRCLDATNALVTLKP